MPKGPTLLILLYYLTIELSTLATTKVQAGALKNTIFSRTLPWNQSLSSAGGKLSGSRGSISLSSELLHTAGLTNWANNNTVGDPTTDGYIPRYDGYCALWNGSCSGNLKEAFSNYDANIAWQEGKVCYKPALSAACGQDQEFCPIWSQCSIDGTSAPETSKSAFAKMRSFARSPQCTSMYEEKHCPGPAESSSSCAANLGPIGPCCGFCYLPGVPVDLYHWPVAGSDTSCLSIIGDIENRLLGATAQTSSPFSTYWGCTTIATDSNGNTTSNYLPTAVLRTIGKLTARQNIFNPWYWTGSCAGPVNTSTMYRASSTSAATLKVRAHPLLNSTRIAGTDSVTSVIVAVSDGFTL